MPATPRLGNLLGNGLCQALRSGRTRTVFYSTLVAVIGSVSFGYGQGFSSPALPELDKNSGEHTYFRKTLYHDLFNVRMINVTSGWDTCHSCYCIIITELRPLRPNKLVFRPELK